MVGTQEMAVLLDKLQSWDHSQPCDLKPLVLVACANMFTQYMCSTSFGYNDPDFLSIVRTFDEIFWEINQGYAVDFLPWLLPLYSLHMKRLSAWACNVRQFILSRIINEHRDTLDLGGPPRDFTDALLMHLEEDPNMNWQHIIFELEDFLGGHSAIGNLIMVTLAYVVKHPEVAKRIQEEVDNATEHGKRLPNLFDKESMPYTEATLWEALRTASSPIVPHVASIDTEINGFTVSKGTVIFINNYELNLGNEYWDDPLAFKPERFLSINNTVVKPAHFIPFSTGKRTCIGQRLVQCFGFIILATILQHFDITPVEDITIKPGSMAVPPDCFKLRLTPRKSM